MSRVAGQKKDKAMADHSKKNQSEQILAKIEAEQVRFVNLEFTDVVGMAKCVTIPSEQLANTLKQGKWFDGSALESFARVAESDMYLFPDQSTFAILPDGVQPQGSGRLEKRDRQEAGRVARVICNVHTPDGENFDGDPRATLLQALELAHTMGFDFQVAPELEFFLLQLEDGVPKPLPHDKGGYFDLSTDQAVSLRGQMVEALQQMGIRIEASHHEVAAGQHELDFETNAALTIADGLMTAKYVLKSIAAAHGLYATFLPKPFFGVNGSGMHIHQQMLHRDSGKNAFVDEKGEYGLSAVARHFIAGQLIHARAMCAILSPLVNSYKRFVSGYEAPVFVNWGRVNREALIRVPRPGLNREDSARVELRCADPSCNPYLALAVMLRAGLDGIQRKLVLPPAMDESLFLRDDSERLQARKMLLPVSLDEAIDELREDSLIREALGDTIYEGFLEAKSIEWAQYRKQVHAWELERYLSIF